MRIMVNILAISFLLTSLVSAEGFDFNNLDLKFGKQSSPDHLDNQIVTTASTRSGIKLSLMPNWKIIHDEPNRLDVEGPKGMWLAINISDYGPTFPKEASLKAYTEQARREQQQGKLISWQERIIDGVRGVERVEAPQQGPTDPRRITWIGYKGTKGVNIVASSKSKDFDNCYPKLNEVVGSLRW